MGFRLLSLFLFLALTGQGQNLIPNPEFTQLNTCCEYRISCAPMGWWTSSNATFKFEQIRYDKYKKPIPEPALVMMQGYAYENQRSYIQAPLLCPLEEGKVYRISLLVKPRNYVFDSIGVLMSDTFIHIPSKEYLTADSVTGLFRNFIMDSLLNIAPDRQLSLQGPAENGMYRIGFDYTASGNEKFIIIGNFRSDRELKKKRRFFHPRHRSPLFYEIGMVSCVAADGSAPLCSIDASIYVLNKMNRRHTFFGACSDSLPPDMNRLFFAQSAWQKVYIKEDLGKLPFQPTFVPQTGKGYRIENLEFEFDKAIIRESSFASLDSLVLVLNAFPYLNIHIEGHTDSLGSVEYNQKLSFDRAKAVTIYLLQSGIDPERLTYSGKGSSKPVAGNDTDDGRQKNRRVEYYLTEPRTY